MKRNTDGFFGRRKKNISRGRSHGKEMKCLGNSVKIYF